MLDCRIDDAEQIFDVEQSHGLRTHWSYSTVQHLFALGYQCSRFFETGCGTAYTARILQETIGMIGDPSMDP